jgi:hypothetical protein
MNRSPSLRRPVSSPQWISAKESIKAFAGKFLAARATLVSDGLAPMHFTAQANEMNPHHDRKLPVVNLKPEAPCGNTTSRRAVCGAAHGCKHRARGFHHQVLQLSERFDALALPTARVWPFAVEERWPKAIAGPAMDSCSR